jgi:hypothetical protein
MARVESHDAIADIVIVLFTALMAYLRAYKRIGECEARTFATTSRSHFMSATSMLVCCTQPFSGPSLHACMLRMMVKSVVSIHRSVEVDANR